MTFLLILFVLLVLIVLHILGKIDVLKPFRRKQILKKAVTEKKTDLSRILEMSIHKSAEKQKVLEKSAATIAYNDSFFGADEWKHYDNPDNDMNFQKSALAPGPVFPA